MPCDDIHRYADCLPTVPLLPIALMLDLPLRQARMCILVLGSLAAAVIVLGHPGRIATTTMRRLWFASKAPLLIIQQLYGGMAEVIHAEA